MDILTIIRRIITAGIMAAIMAARWCLSALDLEAVMAAVTDISIITVEFR